SSYPRQPRCNLSCADRRFGRAHCCEPIHTQALAGAVGSGRGIAMPVAQLTLEIRIEHAQSLKDRRQVVRSLKDHLRHRFHISIDELDDGTQWRSATIGAVAISHSRSYLQGLVDEVERAARRILNEHGAELSDSFWEYIES